MDPFLLLTAIYYPLPFNNSAGIQVMDIAVRYHILENTPDEIIAVYPNLTVPVFKTVKKKKIS